MAKVKLFSTQKLEEIDKKIGIVIAGLRGAEPFRTKDELIGQLREVKELINLK